MEIKNNKKTNSLMICGLFFIAAILISGYAGAATVSVIAPPNVSDECTFEASIVVDNVTDFAGAQFDLSFNSSVVQVTNHTLGNLTNSGAHLTSNTDNVLGKDVVVINNFANPSTGSGSIALITFKVVGSEGTSTYLNLSNLNLSNSAPDNIPVTTVNNATVNVVHVPETCNNGIDDNCDGLIDCCDPDCFGNAVCATDLGNVTAGNVKQGSFFDYGSFSINNSGNVISYNITNISYTFTDMTSGDYNFSKTNFIVYNINPVPSVSSPVAGGTNISSALNISVPANQAPGNYTNSRVVNLTFNTPGNDVIQICSVLKLQVLCGCPSGQNCYPNGSCYTIPQQCPDLCISPPSPPSRVRGKVAYSNGTTIIGVNVSVFVDGVFDENVTTNSSSYFSLPKVCSNGSSISVITTVGGVTYNNSGILNCGGDLELNLTVPVCSDGTLYGQCSATQPKMCSNGVLIDNCSQCGCVSGQSCNATNGTCYLSCSDGTPYNQCSTKTIPLYCSNGNLIDNCSYCGCPAGLNCSVFNLTNVSETAVNAGSENIMWNTNAYANSTVVYGTNSSNLNLTASNSTLVAVHLITLTGLNTTNTTMIYYYAVTSCDCSGNCNTTDIYNFTTAKPNGATCNIDSECLSGSCLEHICKDKLALGYSCGTDANCLSNKCFNGVCSTICTDDSQCPSDEFCNTNVNISACQHKLSAGSLCNRDRMCLSGYCSGSYCIQPGMIGGGGPAGFGMVQGMPLDLSTNATSSTYTNDTFTVTVTSNNIPIQGLKVTYANFTNYTKSDGKVTFTAVEGTHEIKAEGFGYLVKTMPLTIITKPVVLPSLDITINPESPNKDESFTVTVKSNNMPIKDAKVAYGDNTKNTDADGQAQFTSAVGRILISASKDGYTSAQRYLEVTEPVPVLKKLNVAVPGTSNEGEQFTATVTSEGKPVSGVSVTYNGVTKTTDSNGKVSFTSAKGTLQVSASGEGYETSAVSVTGIAKVVPPPAFDWTIPIVILVLLILVLLAYWFLKGRGGVEIKKSREGDNVTVKVKNSGKEDMSNSVIEDVIPPDAKVDIRSLGAELKSGKIVYNVGTVSSGEEKVLEYNIETSVENLPKARVVWDKGEKVSN